MIQNLPPKSLLVAQEISAAIGVVAHKTVSASKPLSGASGMETETLLEVIAHTPGVGDNRERRVHRP